MSDQGDEKALPSHVFRIMREPSWYYEPTKTVLPVAFYLRKLKPLEEGLSILICDRTPTKDDTNRIVEKCPSYGIGSLAVDDVTSLSGLTVVQMRHEKGEIRGMPHRDKEGQEQAAHECARNLSRMCKLENTW